ncbi:MAG TPA: hypothetical protein VL336_07610 [Sphingomicrobium sp.]|jgi:hypothetical protein|nr:hypothetical protein [Sphingomicrobium sp.]
MHKAVVILIALSSSASAANPNPVGQAVGAALQADAKAALAAFSSVDVSTLSPKDQATVTCMRERLGGAVVELPVTASMSERALAIYRSYWLSAMNDPSRRDLEEGKLAKQLGQVLGAPAGTDMDTLEPLLAEALKREGLHSLQGRTGLLRELMIWSKEDSRQMLVALPEQQQNVKVELLDGFTSLGWSEFATCGRASTGGWTTDEALFAVVPRYDSMDGEEFRVSFLSHEAQHFADKARFKDLQPWELEFRAKLTELAEAVQTRSKVLGKFIQDQGDDPGSPHSFANRRLLNGLVSRLGVANAGALETVDPAKLRSAASAMLREDTSRRVGARKGK